MGTLIFGQGVDLEGIFKEEKPWDRTWSVLSAGLRDSGVRGVVQAKAKGPCPQRTERLCTHEDPPQGPNDATNFLSMSQRQSVALVPH